MEQTQDRYIQEILPWRLKALRSARVFLKFVEQYPEGGEYECRVKGLLKLEGKSTAITGPSMEMGLIHSRVLLEFLGLTVTNGTLSGANERRDDINIESFDLPKVTRAQAGIVKLRRIYPFCSRNALAPKREINYLGVAEQSLNKVKQLNLTIPDLELVCPK